MELLKIIFGGGTGAAIVGGLFMLYQWKLNRKAQKEDRTTDKRVIDCKARGEEIQNLHDEMEILKTAIRAQFYNDIKRRAKEYIARQYITIDEDEDLQRDYSIYHDEDKLNGNGFLKGLMGEIEHLEKRVL